MSANRERGELDLMADGKAFTLRLGVNAICQLETLVDRPFDQILTGVRQGSMREARLLLWAALQPYHSDTIRTVDDAGDLMDRAGGTAVLIAKMTVLIGRLVEINQPPEEFTAGQADPPQAQVGTGEASSLRLAESA